MSNSLQKLLKDPGMKLILIGALLLIIFSFFFYAVGKSGEAILLFAITVLVLVFSIPKINRSLSTPK